MKILWKEWQQQKWLFLTGCLVGVSFPVIECAFAWKTYSEFRTDLGSGIVLAFGALYAIILSIKSTYSDTRKGVDIFWQSKPVKAKRLFVTKFLLASILLLLTFSTIISLDIITCYQYHRRVDSFAWSALWCTYPISLALYSTAMFLVVLIRDNARAVLITIWAGLLIYFLPLLVGGLSWMNIFEQLQYHEDSLLNRILNDRHNIQYLWNTYPWPRFFQYLEFLAFMTAVAFIFLKLSVLAIQNNWRWRPGQKTIVWTLGLSAAFIFGVAIFQVGHNLEPVKRWDGKKIVNPAIFGWNHVPQDFQEEIPEGQTIRSLYNFFASYIDAVCTNDDLMYRVSVCYQDVENDRPMPNERDVIKTFCCSDLSISILG